MGIVHSSAVAYAAFYSLGEANLELAPRIVYRRHRDDLCVVAKDPCAARFSLILNTACEQLLEFVDRC